VGERVDVAHEALLELRRGIRRNRPGGVTADPFELARAVACFGCWVRSSALGVAMRQLHPQEAASHWSVNNAKRKPDAK